MISTRALHFCFVVLILSLLTLTFSGCRGLSSSATPPPPPGQAPTINSFAASSSSVVEGSPVTLSWNVSNATSVQIDQGIGPQQAVGSTTVLPKATTTYTLIAANGTGQVSTSVKVEVSTAPPTITLSASPQTITAGETTILSWQTTNATEVELSPEVGESDELPISGSKSVSPAQTTTYVATAKGPGGTAQSNSVTITVNQLPPTVTFTANPTNLLAGQSSTLSWITEHTTSVAIDHGVGNVAAIGSVQVTPAATTTYQLTATGLGGTQMATVTVNVAPANQLAVVISASPTSVAPGTKSTLTWSSQNATSVSIDQGIGPVQTNGSTDVTPTATTTYTATATDANGQTATASTTVTALNGGDFKSKIKHIIFFVQENRSFDNYFSNLGKYKESKGFANDINLDYEPNVQLKGRQGRLVSPFHQRTICTDNLSPAWNESHRDIHEVSPGVFKMDGFMIETRSVPQGTERDPNGDRAMGFYDERDLPYYYEVATQFATSDRWFAPVLTNTVDNRFYLHAGTSFGHINANDPEPAGGWTQKTIWEVLTANNINWGYYRIEDNFLEAHFAFGRTKAATDRYAPISKWFEILSKPDADNLLPQVVFIESGSGGTSLDEHPLYNIQMGAAFTKKMIDALMNSSAWQSSVFIFTFDEGGGLYDHVPPVPMAHPDGIKPILQSNHIVDDFTRTSSRIPLLVISPWVRPHYVSHTKRDFTAILKLIEERFDLPNLTERDRTQESMLEFFDFTTPAWATPPPLPDQPDVLGRQCKRDGSDFVLETAP